MGHCVAFMFSGPVHQPFALAKIPPALPLLLHSTQRPTATLQPPSKQSGVQGLACDSGACWRGRGVTGAAK